MRRTLAISLLFVVVLSSVSGSLHAQTSTSLTVALAHEPDRFYNPTTLAGQLVANLVFDPLVGLDDQMNPYPVLAATIPSPDNGLVHLSGDGADRRLIVTMPLPPSTGWTPGLTLLSASTAVRTRSAIVQARSGEAWVRTMKNSSPP